jgi:hypothetical protein
MEQRDYLMRQIEQLGQVLVQMPARLLGIKQKGVSGFELEELRLTYKNDRLDDGNNLLRKSIYILEYIHSSGKDFSIDRVSKIKNLKDLLKK